MTVTNRSTVEWVGKSPDEQVPTRVRMRVLERGGEKCAHCTRDIRPGDEWCCDHAIALCNGGPNRESNLQSLCSWCTPVKDARDVALKSKGYRIRVAHFGKKKPKGAPMPGSRRSRFRKRMDGTVEIRRTT